MTVRHSAPNKDIILNNMYHFTSIDSVIMFTSQTSGSLFATYFCPVSKNKVIKSNHLFSGNTAHRKTKETETHSESQADRRPDRKKSKLEAGRRRVSSSVRLSVRLFVRCVCQGRPSYGGTNRDASYKFKGGDKNQGSTNKYTKFGQLIIRKIIKKLLLPDVTF